MIWLAAGALMLIVIAVLATPLWRGSGRAAGDPRVAMLRDQIAELESLPTSDVAATEALRIELQRRLLKAAATPELAPSARPKPRLILLLAVPIAAASVALYLKLGAPDAPDQPIAARAAEVAEQRQVTDMVASLKAKLAADPKDFDAWLTLARVQRELGAVDAAVDAARHAIDAGDARPGTASTYAELLVEAARGRVTPAAQAAFQAPAAAGDPRALFYLALAKFQDGDAQGALDGWVALGRASPPDAPWLGAVRDRIAEAAKSLGKPAPVFDPEGVPAPTAPEGQQAMIEAMVARLADRLKADPSDVEGWLRLGRSYSVLGRAEDAKAALAEAAARAPTRLDVQLAYAHALYPPAAAKQAPPETFMALMATILALDPDQPEALWFIGRAAADHGDRARATMLLTKLRDRLPEGSDARAAVEKELAKAGG